jgi:catechol 2,3-dioxygenase-like lactoylglutathione lyase family enzyme
MTIQRMDNVGIVVDDLKAATAFFLELGLELEGEATVEGRWGGPRRRARRCPKRRRNDADS